MALATQSASLVRQKVKNALLNADPGAWYAFKSIFLYLSSIKGNPDLQFVPIDGTEIDAAGGQDHGVDAACTVYAVYLKKAATDTDTYYALFDDATDDAGAGTDGRLSIGLLQSGDTFIGWYPDGIPMAAGIVSKGYTDFDGTTDANQADTPNGFLIIAA